MMGDSNPVLTLRRSQQCDGVFLAVAPRPGVVWRFCGLVAHLVCKLADEHGRHFDLFVLN
jgi:hypothetical protein